MTAQQHEFKAEVRQLLDLMIHSLYSDREIFVRELVSNAADALDRARFLGHTRPDLVAPRGEPEIRILFDEAARTVTIEDDGIGLTEAEAVENLGTIAHSGSKAFLKALADSKDKPSFIGQFGVGFYSAFMVAEKVTVLTRSALPDEPGVLWTSKGEGSYELEKAERPHRGTTVTVKLREDAAEFADGARLRGIVRKYSNFLPWPIRVGGEQANSAKALWLEPSNAVSAEDAHELYRELSRDWRDPALVIHAAADSPIQFNALLFVPTEAPWDLYHPEVPRGPRLYARRVLIGEHARDLLPDWLRFLRGVVSSEDIALNVSREIIQKTPAVQKIRKALTKRVLKDLDACAHAAVEEGKEPVYPGIWREFGAVLKEGYVHDTGEWREYLQPLLRFNALSHADEKGIVSLAEYKAAMKEGQDAIWFLCGPSREVILRSPHLEALRKRGFDVLLMTDPVDEWLVSVLPEFDGTPLKSASRGEVTAPEVSDPVAQEKVADLAPWLHGLFGDTLAGVRSSGRLTDSACVLVDEESGISANMERLLRAARHDHVPNARRWLELNATHPLIQDLAALHKAGRDEMAEPIARMLLDDALLLEGVVKDPTDMGRRLQELLAQAAKSALASGGPAAG